MLSPRPSPCQVLNKKDVVARKQVSCARVERNVMVKVRHPFLVHLKCGFQTKDKVRHAMPRHATTLHRVMRSNYVVHLTHTLTHTHSCTL